MHEDLNMSKIRYSLPVPLHTCMCTFWLMTLCVCIILDAGRDGDWSIQACREETHGVSSGHQTSQISPVRKVKNLGGGGGGGGSWKYMCIAH